MRVCCSSWQVCIGRCSFSPGTELFGSLGLRGGAAAPQIRQLSAQPVPSMKPPTSHGARVRHPPLSQTAVASGISHTVTLMKALNMWLICNGLAPPHDDLRHLGRLPSGGVTRADRTVEAAYRRHYEGSVLWSVCAAPAALLRMAPCEKLTTCPPYYLYWSSCF